MNIQLLFKQSFLFCLLIFSALTTFAQTGSLSGRITTSDGQPANAVSVSLKGKIQKAITDQNGYYHIDNVKPGNYMLRISAVGLTTQEKSITISAEETLTVDFLLAENAEELKEITITETRVNKFSKKESDYVSKMPLKNLENPQVYTTVSKDLMAEQLVFSIDDAMRNAPGVQKMWEATGRVGDGGSYYSTRGFITQSTLRNGVSGLVTSTIDAINLEKLEIIKGPSATLFGSTLTSYGGQINRVTKKPYDSFGGEVSTSIGNYDFSRVSLDLNTPLNKSKTLLFRLNTAYNYQGGFQQNIYSKNLALAPSLLYKPNDRLTISLDAELGYGRNTGNQIFFFYFPAADLGITSADKVNIDYKNSYMGDDLSQRSRNINLFGQANYKISDHFTSSTTFTSSSSFSDGFSPYFYLVPDSMVTHNPADAGKSNYMARADQSTRNAKSNLLEIQQNFNGDFKIGTLRNRIVLGLDFLRVNPTTNFYGIDPFDIVPIHSPGFDYSGFNHTTLQNAYNKISDTAPYISNVKTNTYSAFLSDVLNLTDNLMALAALRLDHFDNKGGTSYGPVEGYKQTSLSPKFGLVYQPIKDKLSVFANYQNSFTNIGYFNAYDEHAADPSVPIKTQLAKPEQANQIEGGIKVDLFDGKLSSTISYYDIRVKNTVRTDLRAPNFAQLQDGTKVSRGIDFELIGNLFKGFNAVAGFSYNNNKFEKADETVNGYRDANSMAPYTANLWLSYRLPDHVVKGLGFGFGGNYASDNKVLNDAENGVFILPAYTVLNASVFYDRKKVRFGFKVDNLNNEHYWIGYGTMNPQKLSSFVGSITYKF